MPIVIVKLSIAPTGKTYRREDGEFVADVKEAFDHKGYLEAEQLIRTLSHKPNECLLPECIPFEIWITDEKMNSILDELSVTNHAVERLKERHVKAKDWSSEECIRFIKAQTKDKNSPWTCVIENNQVLTVYLKR